MCSIVKAVELLASYGDNTLVLTPVYNTFFDVIKHSERNIPTASLIIKNEGGYAINWQDFDLKTKSARMVLLCNPYNPTGTVWSEGELYKIVASYTRYNVWLCSDEIHSDFVFNRNFTSALKIRKEKVVVFNPILKTLDVPALTGLYMVLIDDNFNHKSGMIPRYRDFVNSPSVLDVIVTTIAYNECKGWLKSLKVHITSNVQFTQQYLNENTPELVVRPADGRYFSRIGCPATGYPFDEFHSRLIREDKVDIMAGHVYGMEGEGYLRLNLARGRGKLCMGFTRLVSAIKNINQGG